MNAMAAISVASGLMMAGSALATEMPEIAYTNGCAFCHTIETKKMGPAWLSVAKKYKGNTEAEALLITKVSKGGGGVWGTAIMPGADPFGKKQDVIKQLVQFILALDQ
jgi:cytochrome c551/c552